MPNAKQASLDHISKREKNRAKAVERRRELRRDKASLPLSEGSLTCKEREELLDNVRNRAGQLEQPILRL